MAPLPGEEVVLKHAPNAFFQTSLSGRLCEKGIGHLVIAGMMSHMCIDTTVRSAKDLGFSVTLLEDACATKDLNWRGDLIPAKTVHAAIMAALNGTFANVTTTEEYLNSTETP